MRAGSALRQWLSTEENPFLTRALRTESRRHQPFLSVAIVMSLIVLLNVAAWRFWLFILGGETRLAHRGYSQLHLPDAIGGNAINFFALITACVCALSALICARLRSAALLRQELLRSTLDSLQLLPIREERWLWLLSAHPLLLSLLIGACGLPVYMLAVCVGDWNLTDLIGLFFVFVWLGHVAPLWQPVAWKQGGARTQQKVNWKTLRAQMSTNSVELPRSLTESEPQNLELAAHLVQANRLELQRRQQRLALGAAPNPLSSTGNEAPDEPDATDKKTNKNNASQRANKNWFGSAFGFYYLFRLLFLVTRWSPTSSPAHLLSALWRDIFAALPENVVALWPGFLFTWPLLLARTALAPLPFFRFAVPPLWIFAVLWVGFTTLRNTNLASLVSSSETFWTTRRVRKQNRTSRFLWICAAIAFLGYAWPTFITSGELSSILGDLWPSTARSLAALWTIFVIGAAIAAARNAEAILSRAGLLLDGTVEENANWQARVWRQTAHRVLDVFTKPLLAYFLFCLIGNVTPWNASWLARLAPTLFTSLAFVVAVFGAAALQNTLPVPDRAPWKTVRFLWFWGLAIEVLARYIIGVIRGAHFTLEQSPHTVYSPIVSLLALLRGDVSTVGGIAWPMVAGVQALAGLICFTVAWTIVFRHAPRVETPVVEGEVSLGERIVNVLMAPFRLAGRVLTAIYEFFKHVFDWMAQKTNAVNERVISRGAQIDNAVLTSELRRRVRKSNWCRQWILISLVFFALFSLFFLLPLFSDFATQSQIVGWSQAFAGIQWADYGSWLLLVTGIIATLLAALCVLNAGQSFDSDRANGTMVFLFLTPMSDRAIIWGKSVVELIYATILLTIAIPYLLLGILLSFIGGDLSIFPYLLVGVPFVLSIGIFATYLNILFAVRARKPSEGSAKALLVLLLFEGAMIVAGVVLSPLQTVLSFKPLFALALGVILLHLALAVLWHRLALLSLRKLRYGDIATGGKMAS